MPLHNRKDKNGPYFQWGGRKKYYYKTGSERSKKMARDKAMKQARAIAWRKHGGAVEGAVKGAVERDFEDRSLGMARKNNQKNKNTTQWSHYFQHKFYRV
jgi:hypothetical protein